MKPGGDGNKRDGGKDRRASIFLRATGRDGDRPMPAPFRKMATPVRKPRQPTRK